MIRAWRLVKESRAQQAFSGEGARLYGGRWNLPGTAVVYVADSLALAALEVFVHMGAAARSVRFVAFPVRFPPDFVEVFTEDELPEGWRQLPAPPQTMTLGSDWAAGAGSVVLQVPSVLVTVEHNYVFNPLHPDFEAIEIGAAMPFSFDPRMWAEGPGQGLTAERRSPHR